MDERAEQEILQADLLAVWQFYINECFGFHLFIECTLGKIDWDLDVVFSDEILSVNPSVLTDSLSVMCENKRTFYTTHIFDYFRAINLVYPTFLTGLEQRNSDFKLHGPYVSIKPADF